MPFLITLNKRERWFNQTNIKNKSTKEWVQKGFHGGIYSSQIKVSCISKYTTLYVYLEKWLCNNLRSHIFNPLLFYYPRESGVSSELSSSVLKSNVVWVLMFQAAFTGWKITIGRLRTFVHWHMTCIRFCDTETKVTISFN